MTKHTGYDVVRINGETGRREVIDTAETAESARGRADQAKRDAKIVRPGNSDTITVRVRQD